MEAEERFETLCNNFNNKFKVKLISLFFLINLFLFKRKKIFPKRL